MHLRPLLTAAALLLVATAPAPAETIAAYLDGTHGDPAMPAYASHPHVTASTVDNSAFAAGPVRDGWVGVPLGTHWLTSAHNGTNPADIGPAASDADVRGAKGYAWTVTADPGMRITLDTLTIDFGIVAQHDSRPTDWGYRLFVEIDGNGFTSVGSDSTGDHLPDATFREKSTRTFAVGATTRSGGSLTVKLVDWGKVTDNAQQFGSSANTFRDLRLEGTVSDGDPAAPSLRVRAISYDPIAREVTVRYDTPFPGGVDVYTSDDLRSWESDGAEPATGADRSFTRPATAPARHLLLVEPGAPPPGG